MIFNLNFIRDLSGVGNVYSGAPLQQKKNTKKQFGFLGDSQFATSKEFS